RTKPQLKRMRNNLSYKPIKPLPGQDKLQSPHRASRINLNRTNDFASYKGTITSHSSCLLTALCTRRLGTGSPGSSALLLPDYRGSGVSTQLPDGPDPISAPDTRPSSKSSPYSRTGPRSYPLSNSAAVCTGCWQTTTLSFLLLCFIFIIPLFHPFPFLSVFIFISSLFNILLLHTHLYILFENSIFYGAKN
uniref:Uncharacterized protein n=1 Tax=Pseudonaja textilis TaxID=8673 RepID=A0A670YRQ6_PSETE